MSELNLTEDQKLRNDPELKEAYADLFGMFPDHPVTMDGNVLRWKRSLFARWICDNVDLNKMAVAYNRGEFSLDDYAKFYRDIGYSLSGYIDVMGEKLGLFSYDWDEITKG